MRAKLLHPATLIALLALLVALEVPSRAADLIDGKLLRKASVTGAKLKDGAVKQRKLAPRVRARLKAAAVPGPPGPAGPAGAPGPAGAAPSCPAGTALHEAACIELARRGQAEFYDAFDACDQDERRLATLAELQSFRFRGELDPPDTGSEWVDGALSDDGAATREAAYLTMNQGIPDLAAISSLLPYRCVARASAG